MLREAARTLANKRRVVIVDTSNEIGGDGDVPHPAIGNARRMQVSKPDQQHEVMIEAVENHNPQVIIIDEIGRELEAQAARTIAERGVQLIGTAHGNTLENLLRNPTLSDLVGGIESVTLSDDEARRRGTQKSVLERRAPPTFNVLVEIQDRQRLLVHTDVALSVDAHLRGRPIAVELRYRNAKGEIVIESVIAEPTMTSEKPDFRNGKTEPSRNGKKSDKRPPIPHTPLERQEREIVRSPSPTPSVVVSTFSNVNTAPSVMAKNVTMDNQMPDPSDFHDIEDSSPDFEPTTSTAKKKETVFVYAYGIARNRLSDAAAKLNVPMFIVDDMTKANVLVTLKNHYRRRPRLIVDAEQRNIPIYVLRANTASQVEDFIADLFGIEIGLDEKTALEEARIAIQRIHSGARVVELKPQISHIRRQQHTMASAANVVSQSYGNEPNRYVRFFRSEDDVKNAH
jgi:hypothetical protein